MALLPNIPIQTQGIIDASRFTLRGPDGSEAKIGELRQGFKQGFVFEVLDLAAPEEPLEVHVMVLNPVRYNLSEPFQVTITPGEDDMVVVEENGIIVREITLEGTYGLRNKTARGFLGAQGSGQSISGTEHFNALRNMFRRYSALKKDPERSANIVMIFHALRDDDHFIVVPRSFETPRDAQRTRVHQEYRISLAAVDEALVTGLRPDEASGGGDFFTDALRDINEAFNDARAGIAEVTANVAEIRRKVGNIQAVLGNAAQIINAVGGLVSGVATFINYPLQLVATVAEQLVDASDSLVDSIDGLTYGTLHENARSLRRIEAAIDRIAMYDEKFQDITTRIETLFEGERALTNADVSSGTSSAPGAGGATIGSRTRTVAGSDGRLAGLDVPRNGGMRSVTVLRTDSLESIAGRAGTTPEAIIVINDLRAPYITEAGGPGILAPGDTVLVPSSANGPSTTGRGAVDFLSAQEALYGVDLAIDAAILARDGRFDLAVDETAGSTDLALVRGVPNVVQGTEITINTERGTTAFLRDIGIRRNVGVKGTIQHVLLASITLREALLSDPRISSIQSARVVLDGDTLTQEITPVVSGQRSGSTFVLPFGRASSGE